MHAEARNITCRSTVEKLHIWGSCAWILENLMFCSFHIIIFSLFFLSFPFFSTLIKAIPLPSDVYYANFWWIISNIMLILCRCQSVSKGCWLNCPWVWFYKSSYSVGLRNLAMCDFCREHFQINIKSFQALSCILSLIYSWLFFPSSRIPIANYVTIEF